MRVSARRDSPHEAIGTAAISTQGTSPDANAASSVSAASARKAPVQASVAPTGERRLIVRDAFMTEQAEV